jgi:hypothetical protein
MESSCSSSCFCARSVAHAFALMLVFASVLAINACGSGASPSKSPPVPVPVPVAVTVSPATASVQGDSTLQFTATVTGTSNTAVTWSVDGIGSGNATVGTISAAGLYTALGAAGQHTITATSTADPTKSASATVTVPPVSVTLSPANASVQATATTQFTAAVTGTSNTTVAWFVDNISTGNTTVGTISAAGLYTAPGVAGEHTITATSVADSTKSASAIVTVSPPPPVSVTVSPAKALVPAKSTTQFTAAVTATSNIAVTWSVDGIGGGNATVGTISTAGLYTAPDAAGQHTITATSVADSTKSANATVTIQIAAPPPAGDITVDFNLRSDGVAIAAGLFGAQLGNLSDPIGMSTLVGAGISGTRLFANVQNVFAVDLQHPNFTLIDPILDRLQASGMKPILMIADTPTWLQPTVNPCSELPPSHNAHPYNAAPTDNNAYASIAAQYVAHIDQKYPGLVQYYEIWNEADETNQFCGLNSGDTTNDSARSNEYVALYKAIAIAMKQQAATDRTSILVGGPALGNSNSGLSDFWITKLVQLNNGASTRLVDFVSYHQYLAGADVSHTITWDGAGGTPSLLSRTLSPSTGSAAVYRRIAGPTAASIAGPMPVIFDEFNDDFDFFNDCCKNSPTFSPVWNTMVFSLLLDSVYNGAPPPQHLSYYSADNQPFCMLGNPDNGLFDCGQVAPLLPYPQFRAFELLASPNLLGLQASGGNVAKSLSQSSVMNSAGLVAAAFYTPGSDAVVLVNPTSVPISNAVLVIGNHGLNNPTATQFLLNSTTYSATAPVAGVPLQLTVNGVNAQATVTIPPLSVLAVKVTGQ